MDLLEKIRSGEVDPDTLSRSEQIELLTAMETSLQRFHQYYPVIPLGIGRVPVVTNLAILNAFLEAQGLKEPDDDTTWHDPTGKIYRIRDVRLVNLPGRRMGIAQILEDPETEKVSLRFFSTNPTDQRLNMLTNTLVARSSTGLAEAEERARERLKNSLDPHQWQSYVLTDSFVEVSPRSGLDYLLRRNRPTIAINPVTQKLRVALCLHPLGYYAESWAGFLPPSDEIFDVVTLIRGDEPELWKRANQISWDRLESGL